MNKLSILNFLLSIVLLLVQIYRNIAHNYDLKDFLAPSLYAGTPWEILLFIFQLFGVYVNFYVSLILLTYYLFEARMSKYCFLTIFVFVISIMDIYKSWNIE